MKGTVCGGVLVVDDDEAIRLAIVQALDEEGYDATGAPNGASAMTLLRAPGQAPCVILLDMMMPVLDGRAFLEVKRADPALAAIPVVVVTADARAFNEAMEMEARVVLCKPISLETLLEAVSQYCHKTHVLGA